MDRSWEETNARHREERFAKKKRGMDAERREHRAEMTGLELHRLAVERAGRLARSRWGTWSRPVAAGRRSGRRASSCSTTIRGGRSTGL